MAKKHELASSLEQKVKKEYSKLLKKHSKVSHRPLLSKKENINFLSKSILITTLNGVRVEIPNTLIVNFNKGKLNVIEEWTIVLVKENSFTKTTNKMLGVSPQCTPGSTVTCLFNGTELRIFPQPLPRPEPEPIDPIEVSEFTQNFEVPIDIRLDR